MAEAAHLWHDGIARYAWYLPGDRSLCKYLLVDGREVVVTMVSRVLYRASDIPSNMICLGEVVACTSDTAGHSVMISDKVTEWLAARLTAPAMETMLTRQEAKCRVPSCQRMNDVGVANCWNCGTSNPVSSQ